MVKVFFFTGITFWLAASNYLAGSPMHFGAFLLFLFSILIPLSVLSVSLFARLGFPASLRIVFGLIFAFIALIPWFMFRKCFADYRLYLDMASSISLLFFSYRSLKQNPDIRQIESFPKLFWIVQFFVLPLIVCLNWVGFEAPYADKIYYFGQHIIDTGTLSGVISSICASPFLPLYPVTGLGELNYHWLFFTIPAFMSEFMGLSIRHANSMALCNLLMGHLLFLTLYCSADLYLDNCKNKKAIQALGPTLILVASFSFYYYLALGFTIPQGNHLLMTLPYSICYFGNNTLALTCIIASLMLISEWNRTSKIIYVITGSLLLAFTVGLSATLIFSVALGMAMTLLFGQVAKPLKFVSIGIFVGALCMVLFKFLCLFEGGHTSRLGIEFDHGRFVFNFFIAFLPAVAVSCFGIKSVPRQDPFLIFIVSCLIIPTFLLLQNSPDGRIEFSMKTSSLIIALMAPVFTKGLENIAFGKKNALKILPLFLLLLGLFLFYLTSSTFVKLTNTLKTTGAIDKKHFAVDKYYFAALDYIRMNTSPDSIIIDPYFENQKEAHVSLMISQRRLFLPILKDLHFGIASEEVLKRRQIWKDWEKGSFQNQQTSLYFSKNADYLVIKEDIHGECWGKIAQRGEYQIYRSLPHKN